MKLEDMKRGFQFGIFALAVVLSAYFVFATSWDKAPSTAAAGDTKSMLTFNVSNLTSNMSLFRNVEVNITGRAYLGLKNITNVTISNGTHTFHNDSFTTSPVNISIGVTNVNTSNPAQGMNWTINFTLNSSATYNTTFGANVTAIRNSSNDNLSYSPLPYTSGTTNITESTNPTATATCSPKDIYVGEAFPCTCSGTDSGATDSGISTNTGTSDSPDGTSAPQTIGVFTYTCAVTDVAGNSATDTETYAVLASGGGSPGPKPSKNTHSWTKITPGVASIIHDFDPKIGVKEIQITVNSEAQNVKITVTKYDGKPAEVSVSKSGKIYQYLQINAQNLAANLDKADVQFRVEKSWVSSNGLNKEKVSVYKFDGVNKWNELQTTYAGEDDTYYYYDAEVSSFSYFAISEKSLVSGEGTTSTGEEPVAKGGSMTWLWILIIVAVIVAFVWWAMRKK